MKVYRKISLLNVRGVGYIGNVVKNQFHKYSSRGFH